METLNLDQSFLKKNRLLTKNDFINLRDGSRFLVSGIFLFYFKKNTLDFSRIGLAVSKKLGKANKRNRIKRRIRENFRQSTIGTEGLDFLVTMNFRLINKEKLTFDEIDKAVDKSLIDAFEKMQN